MEQIRTIDKSRILFQSPNGVGVFLTGVREEFAHRGICFNHLMV